MLTPQLIDAMNKATGNNVPLTPDAPPSRAEQVRALGRQSESQPAADTTKTSGIGDLAKSLVSAPATMVARPVQAAQSAGQLFGSDTKGLADVAQRGADTMLALEKARNAAAAQGKDTSHFDKTIADMRATPDYAGNEINAETNYQPSSGGIVAPAPQNTADVKKDIGRATETVALGLGPVSGGAAFGAGNSLEQGNDLFSGQTAFQTALGAAGGKLLDVIGKPVFDAAGKQIGKVTPQFLQDLASKGTKAIQDFAAAHDILPDFASNVINKGAKMAENVANKPFNAIDSAAQKTVNTVNSGARKLTGAVPEEEKALQDTIQAVDPTLTGKRLVNAYQDVVKGGREVGTKGLTKKQILTPSQKTAEVGVRLHNPITTSAGTLDGIPLTKKDPVGNLDKLSTGLDQTEAHIGHLLENDTTKGTAQELSDKVNDLKASIPREFRTIKNSQESQAFQNMVDFAKEEIEKAPDTSKGFREARIRIDNQARKEFPNAFTDDGQVNVKTPAGNALRAIRDTMNTYTYSNSSLGKEIESLIEREADIFKAAHASAQGAAKLHGSDVFARFTKQHPVLGPVFKKGMNMLRLGEAVHLGTSL